MKTLLTLIAVAALPFMGASQYCLPTYNNACTSGDHIESFSFNTILNLNTGCTNPGANNYTDYTATFSTNINPNQTYTVTCEAGANWGQYFAVWIDFDQNLVFDPSEHFDIGYAAAGTSISTPITIPGAVVPGTTTLRVLCHFGTGAIGAGDACAAQTWGECEDYAVVIGTPPANEVAATSIDGPMGGCNLGIDTVMGTITNNSTANIDTVVMCYRSNGGPWMCDTVTGLALPNMGTYQHSFSDLLDLSTPNDYYIDMAVTLLGDTINVNDSLFGYFIQSIPTISSLPYSEDFEAGTGGWSSSGTLSNWEWGVLNQTDIFGSGGCGIGDTAVWATGLSSPYNNNATAYLESPCIDFSGLTSDPLLTFDHMFNVEPGFDNHWVEISTNGGGTWTTLGAGGTGLNWYNNAADWDNLSYANPGEWRKAGHILTGTAGQSDVRIRFVLTTDGSVQREGVAIDNINIDAAIPFVDAMPSALTTPISGCGLTANEFITADFINVGLDTLIGFDVCYILNGGTPVCENVTDSLIPGVPYTHIFGTAANLSAVGAYTIELVVTTGSDLDACNDTMAFSVQNKPEINTFPYLETFENGPGGWEAQNGASGTWELATPAGAVINSAGSGQNSWVTNASGFYNVNDNSSVLGPCFNFTTLDTGSWVAMKVWWETENSWDGANLQVSTDTGNTWQNIGALGSPNNWYNDNSISGAPGGSQEGWTGDVNNIGSGGWVIAKHPLDTALVGNPHVLFRVAFGSDGSVTRDGFAFDDFAIGVPPTINIGPDFIGCANYEIDPGLPGTYEWIAQDTGTLATNQVSTDPVGVFTNPFTADTTYNAIVVYTDSLGLCASDTAMLTLHPAPYNVLNDTSICFDDSVLYSVDTASWYTYSWNNGSSVDSSLYTYTTGGPVQVVVTDTISGCADTATATIFQVAPVDIDNAMACDGDTAIIDAGSLYNTYTWSNGDSVSVLATTMGGSYTVTVTDSIGCMSMDSATVTINPLPTPSISGSSDTICINHDLPLDAGAGFSAYSWSTGGTSQTENLTGTGLGTGSHTITVTVTDGNGCIGSDSVVVFVDPCPGVAENTIDFHIYPNPSNGLYNYEVTGNIDDMVMTVTDVTGKLLSTDRVLNNRGVIDLTHLSRGTYVLQFTQDGVSTNIRLIKQ